MSTTTTTNRGDKHMALPIPPGINTGYGPRTDIVIMTDTEAQAYAGVPANHYEDLALVVTRYPLGVTPGFEAGWTVIYVPKPREGDSIIEDGGYS
jgi:hypothetical protein